MTEHLPDAMVEAGGKAYLASEKNADIPGTFTAIYRAMRPLDPEVQALVEVAGDALELLNSDVLTPTAMNQVGHGLAAALSRFTDAKGEG